MVIQYACSCYLSQNSLPDESTATHSRQTGERLVPSDHHLHSCHHDQYAIQCIIIGPITKPSYLYFCSWIISYSKLSAILLTSRLKTSQYFKMMYSNRTIGIPHNKILIFFGLRSLIKVVITLINIFDLIFLNTRSAATNLLISFSWKTEQLLYTSLNNVL